MNNSYKTVTERKLKSFFYRDNFYRMFKWLFISFFILLLFITWAIYLYFNKPQKKYYAISQNGIVKQLIPEQ